MGSSVTGTNQIQNSSGGLSGVVLRNVLPGLLTQLGSLVGFEQGSKPMVKVGSKVFVFRYQ